MSSEPSVRLLTGTDAGIYRAVRLAALQSDPDAFITTAAEFEVRTLESVAGRIVPSETAVTYGAFVEGELVGLLTLTREERPRLAHRANIFGVSVAPQARGQGCGNALMRAALAHARGWPGVTSIHLSVTETQTAARRLYERHGFQVWGTQPDAVRDGAGRALAEQHMILLLRDLSTEVSVPTPADRRQTPAPAPVG